jgi:mannose-1-phosphate guanylyltransferase / mannose-6-phosphate isomerase
MMTKILAAVMCGGSCPPFMIASRASLPKEFIPLIGDQSSFQLIVALAGDRKVFEEPVVITNFNYRFQILQQLREIGAEATILLEPEPRYSAAAVGALAAYAAARDLKTVVAALAGDHVFKDRAKFVELCAQAGAAAAAGEIVAFGITPDHPATVYSYIHPAEPLAIDPKVRRVERFVEKPDEERARALIEDGFLWNSGNYVFRADVMLEELERFEPEIAAATKEAVALGRKDLGFVVLDRDAFLKAPSKSIETAVMERTQRAAVLAADVGWSDVGQWSVIWQLGPRETEGVGNESIDAAMASMSWSDKPPADKLKDLVERLKAEGRAEATPHQRVYRPWGFYQTVDEGVRHEVRRIVVRPGKRLSLQKHNHRAEHWIIIRGVAEVTLDGAVQLVQEHESIDVPVGTEHRLGNPGRVDLELIEVQTGSDLGGDDIVRIGDVYNSA